MKFTYTSETLRKALAEYVKKPGNNLYELSMKSGTHRPSLVLFLKGKNIMLDTADKIAPFLFPGE